MHNGSLLGKTDLSVIWFEHNEMLMRFHGQLLVWCIQKVFCVWNLSPLCRWPGCLTWREGEVASSTVASSQSLLPVRRKHFWKFFLLSVLSMTHMINWSVFRFPSCEMLNHLQKMSAVLTPELSDASDRTPWGGMCYHTIWGEHLFILFPCVHNEVSKSIFSSNDLRH